MVNKKKCMLIVGLSVLLFINFVPIDWSAVSAQNCRIIRLYGIGEQTTKIGSVNIEPRVVWIEAGDCVIWYNWVKDDETQIVFEEGKRCEDMTDAPSGFTLNAHNCYVTSYVPLGGTSSLKFTDAGTFYY